MKKSVGTINLSLIGNGLDFIDSALGHLSGQPSTRNLKYAALHLSAGIELVLKERLRKEHWSLVFDNPGNANRKAYESGEFKSVSLRDVVIRLGNIAGVQLTEVQQAELERLRKRRNQFEHFGTVDSLEALRSSAARALNVLLDFIVAEFDVTKLSADDRDLFTDIRRKLHDVEGFIEKRRNAIAPALTASDKPVVWCSSCAQEAAIVGCGTKCLFCGQRQLPDEAAVDYVISVLATFDEDEVLDDFPIRDCPRCHAAETLVDCVDADQPQRFLCFNCGATWQDSELRDCTGCGELVEDAAAAKPLCVACAGAKTSDAVLTFPEQTR